MSHISNLLKTKNNTLNNLPYITKDKQGDRSLRFICKHIHKTEEKSHLYTIALQLLFEKS